MTLRKFAFATVIALSTAPVVSFAQITSPPKTVNKVAQYDLQERCGKRVEALYGAQDKNTHSGDVTKILNYENHYNSSLNICLVKVAESSVQNGMMTLQILTLIDVNSHKQYGIAVQDKDGNVTICQATFGYETRQCNSIAEWSELIRPYLFN